MAQKKIVIDDRAKIIIGGIVIALLTYLLAYQVIYKNLSSKIAQTRKDIVEEYQRLVLSKDIAKIDSLREKYYKYLHTGASQDSLRDMIAGLAKETDMQVVAIQPQQPKKVGECTIHSFTVTLRCGYHDLGEFIEGIEKMTAMTTISEMKVTNYKGPESYDVPKDFLPENKAIADVTLVIDAYCI